MMNNLIILTNDDGIESPGLWAAYESLITIGEVLVVAPLHQQTSVGRSMPTTSIGRIHTKKIPLHGKSYQGFAVEASPAQAVQFAVLELANRKPSLVVAGINYGENVGIGVTISGTVGAAMEAATFGIPGLAMSLQVDRSYYLTHSIEIDFSVAAYFTAFFSKKLLKIKLPHDVDLLKVDIPSSAKKNTPWKTSRLSRQRYYYPIKSKRDNLSDPGVVDFSIEIYDDILEPDSDIKVLSRDKTISVTPLSLDITSRIDLKDFYYLLEEER